MCVVSNIGDYGRQQWPQPWKTIPLEPGSWPSDTPSREAWDEYKDLIEKAKEFDQKTGQPECESEEKTAWMKDMEDRISQLEQRGRKEYPFFDFGSRYEELVEVRDFLTSLNAVLLSDELEAQMAKLNYVIGLMEEQFG